LLPTLHIGYSYVAFRNTIFGKNFLKHLVGFATHPTKRLITKIMPRKDIYHDTVKRALIKDGWTITHDQFTL